MAHSADCDDRRSVTFGLARPYRLTWLVTKNGPAVQLESIHAFMWLALKYQESKRKRLAKHTASYMRQQSLRLLTEWLLSADFDKENVH